MLAVMLEKEQFVMSCYKIMSLLAIVDILSVLCSCIITGWLAYQGAVYCSYPNLIYIVGMAEMGLWCGSCVIAVILVTNRLLDLILPNLGSFVFGGNRTFFILIIPILYGLYFVFFTTPVCFTSEYHAWFFDPMIFKDKEAEYANIPHIFNNFFVVLSTTLLYAVFCCALCLKLKTTGKQSQSRNVSTQIFFQSAMICAVNMSAAIIYVIMNYIVIPYWMILLGTFMYQLGNCAPVLIYWKFNKTLRNGVLGRIRLKKPQTTARKKQSTSQVVPATPAAF
ncbi:unnamed protein product [Caenorhabditis nigoni]